MGRAQADKVSGAHSRRRIGWFVVLIAVLIGLLLVIQRYHWDARLYYSVKSHWSENDWRGRSLWLPDYQAVIEARPIEGVRQNLSSILYDPEHDRLLGVTNGPAEIVALSKEGDLLARYPLMGFGDVEAIGYLGDGMMVMVDERAQQFSFAPLPEQPGPIRIEQAQVLSLGINLNGNKGFEGTSYDPVNDRLFVVKERDPRQLYEIRGVRASLGHGLHLHIHDRTEWIERSVFGTDLSGVHYDPATGHLVVLSDESNLLVEMTDQGEFVSFRTLLGGWFGRGDLHDSAPQPEGVALDDQGNLYVVSEPNLFYRFRKPAAGAVNAAP